MAWRVWAEPEDGSGSGLCPGEWATKQEAQAVAELMNRGYDDVDYWATEVPS